MGEHATSLFEYCSALHQRHLKNSCQYLLKIWLTEWLSELLTLARYCRQREESDIKKKKHTNKTGRILGECWYCSIAQLCLTLCNPMNWSMPDFPVLHYLQEFAHTHVHSVDDAIQPSHPLSPPFSSCPQSFPVAGSFPMSLRFTSGDQTIGASTSASILPMNFQGWFHLWLTGMIFLQSNGLSRDFSSTPVWKHQFLVLGLLYGPTLMFVHDYWKNHSLDYEDLCWQSDVFAF